MQLSLHGNICFNLLTWKAERYFSFIIRLTSSEAVLSCQFSETAVRRFSIKQLFLKFYYKSQENTYVEVFLKWRWRLVAWRFIKKETPTQVFSCIFYEISTTFFFTKHLRQLLLNFNETADLKYAVLQFY